MEVLACDAYAKPDGVARLTTLDEVLAKSDVISLHCPLTPETQGIINRETLANMKDGAFLLNTSRGPLVDEDALADALQAARWRAPGWMCWPWSRRLRTTRSGAAKLPDHAAYRLGAEGEPPAADGHGGGQISRHGWRRASECGESINGYEKGPPLSREDGEGAALQVADKVWGLPGCSIIRAALTVARMVSLPRCKSLWVVGPTAHRAGASLRATGPALLRDRQSVTTRCCV